MRKASYDSPDNRWTLNAHQFLYSMTDYDSLSVKEVDVSVYPKDHSDRPLYHSVISVKAEQNLSWQADWLSNNEVVLVFFDRETGAKPQYGNTYKTPDGRDAPRRKVREIHLVHDAGGNRFVLNSVE